MQTSIGVWSGPLGRGLSPEVVEEGGVDGAENSAGEPGALGVPEAAGAGEAGTEVMAQCAETVEKRDAYRVNRTGRGAHFKLHYTTHQCSRQAQDGSRYCWQHRPWHVIEEGKGSPQTP